MKRLLLPAILLLFFTGNAFSQGTTNLILFAEQGEKFTVVLNGLRINDKPETNVKIADLNTEYYKLKVVFEDEKIADMDKNVMLKYGSEVTYNIRKNKKGEYVLAYQSEAPIPQNVQVIPGQTRYVYTQVAPNDGMVIRGGTTTVTSTTTMGTGTSTTVNAGGMGMGVSITVNEPVVTGTTTYSSTTTTTTTGGTTGGTYVESGCMYPMSSGDFGSAKSSISSKSFEDSKLTMAKQIIDANCMSTTQIKEIMMLFSFEETRLDLAKYSYRKATDPSNYYKLNDAFTFESSIDELNQYINANGRPVQNNNSGW